MIKHTIQLAKNECGIACLKMFYDLYEVDVTYEDLFSRLVNFIKHKMFGKEKEREDYWGFSKDLYEHGIFSDKTITDIKDDYDWNKENDKRKDHDDFDLEI